jgi:hypothetical protein
MTAFFVPGIGGDEQAVERAYDRMRRQTELEMGRRPTSRRIFGLWTRRGTVDCVTQVGERDPLLGGTVVAIFDMGASQPFVVWWQQELGSTGETQVVLGCSAYSVQDFDG